MPIAKPMPPAREDTGVRIRVARTPGEFALIRDRWDRVVQSRAHAPVQLSSIWIDQWWNSFGHGAELAAILFEDAAGPLGVAPILHSTQRVGPLSIPTLRLIGNELTERSEIVFTRRRAEAWRELEACLDKSSWQFFDYGWGTEGSDERLLLLDSAWPYSVQLRQTFDLPLVSLDAPWVDWLAQKSRTFRKSLRKASEKCEGLTVLTFPDDFDEIDRLLTLIESVTLNSWSFAQGTAIQSDPCVRDFISGVLCKFHAQGDVLASFLMDGNRPLAFAFGISFGSTIFGLKTSYRTEIRDRSLGTRVMAAFVERCMEWRDSEVLDMDCITTHSEYKRRWANEFDCIVTHRIFRHQPLSRALSLAYRLKKLSVEARPLAQDDE